MTKMPQACCLSWTAYILSTHADVQAKLCEEVDRVLGGTDGPFHSQTSHTPSLIDHNLHVITTTEIDRVLLNRTSTAPIFLFVALQAMHTPLPHDDAVRLAFEDTSDPPFLSGWSGLSRAPLPGARVLCDALHGAKIRASFHRVECPHHARR